MKTKIFYLLLFICSISYSQIPTSDLVREYLFTNGSLVNNANPGTNDFVATGTTQVSVNDAIHQPNNALDINTDTFLSGSRGAGQNVSVSFWIKTGTIDATVRSVINQFGAGGFGSYGWKVQLVDGKIKLYTKSSSGGGQFAVVETETAVIADNSWHHITFTAKKQDQPGYNAYGYFSRLYVDGTQQDTGVAYTSGAFSILNNQSTATNSFTHHISLSNATDPFTDNIDNIRIYNRDLSAVEVTELYKEHYNSLTRLYVNKVATGNGFGDSWANAFTDLNDALAVANGQEIWVAQGTYTPNVSARENTITVSEGVKLYGGFVGNEVSLQDRDIANNVTSLSGDLLGNDTNTLSISEPTRLENSYRVVTIAGDNTLIDGFTITGGHANTSAYNIASGIYKGNSVNNMELRNNSIVNNVVKEQAVIYAMFPDSGAEKTAIIDNCIIKNNLARGKTAFRIGFNYTTSSGPTVVLNAYVRNSLIDNNFASDVSGYKGISASAGAFSSFILANRVLNAYVENCTITNNIDNGTDTALTNPALINGIGNTNFNMYNTIVWNNSITKTYTRNHNSTGYLACQYSTIFKNNNTADDLSTICSGVITLLNNTSVDPLFTNSTNDFTLQSGSPVIDAGDNAFVNTTKDILGNDRIYNGAVDMGAYESTFGPNNKSLALNIVGLGTLSQTSGNFVSNTTVSITATPNYGAVFKGWTGDVVSTNPTISVVMDTNKSITATFESPLYVKSNATGNNDGSNWADAYTTLQDALANANNDDEIWIASGTYKPHASDKSVSYTIDKENLKIYGGFVGTETQLSDRVLGSNETILSGDLSTPDVNVANFGGGVTGNYQNPTRSDNSLHIISITASGNNLLLDALTISDAHYVSVNDGGAIIKEASVAKLKFKNCIIKDNVSRQNGAGLYALFILNNASGIRGELIIENSQFINNMSRRGSGIYSRVGSNTNVDIIITNTLFDGNITGDINASNTGLSGSAGWFRMEGNSADANLSFINNTLVNNIDEGTGQGLDASSHAVLGISEFSNSITGTLNAIIANTVFWNNKTTGGVVTKSITDLFKLPVTSVNIYNSIDEADFNDSSISSITNTSNADPLFTSTTDFTLQTSSPAKDSGDNSKIPSGITTDLVGNLRVFNTTVDMGVYEFGSSVPVDRTLTITAPNGSVTTNPDPTNGIYADGTVVSLTATPATGYQFDGWSGDASGISNTVNITMDADKSVTATFSLIQRVLTINASNGTVTTNPNPTNGTYDDGTVVGLTATPAAGYQFDGWSGDASGATNTVNITMDADKSVTATFSLIQRVLTINASNGTVTTNPNPTNGTYDDGTVVGLTATPATGYQFDGWSGDASGATNSVNITMDADKSVTATFSLIPIVQRTLTINASNGTVTTNPNPTNGTYDTGTVVGLTATPATGYQFDGWSGDASGMSNSVNITMDADKSVTATFSKMQRTLTITATNGTVTTNPNPTNGTYDDGTVVGLTTTPATGYQFDGWSGDASGTSNTVNITMDADKTVTATFSLIQRVLTITIIGTGTVTPISGTTYNNGDVVTLIAAPGANSAVKEWTGAITAGATNTVQITMDADKTVTVEFESTLGIDDVDKIQGLKMYPNPTKGNVIFDLQEAIKTIELYNLQGKVIKKFTTKEIDISAISNGIYIVKITSISGKIAIKKILKN